MSSQECMKVGCRTQSVAEDQLTKTLLTPIRRQNTRLLVLVRHKYWLSRRSTTGEHKICSRKRDGASFVLTNTVRPRFNDGMPACAKYHYITRKNKSAFRLSCRSDVNRRKALHLPDLSTNCAVFCG